MKGKSFEIVCLSKLPQKICVEKKRHILSIPHNHTAFYRFGTSNNKLNDGNWNIACPS